MNWFEFPSTDTKLPPPDFSTVEGARAWLGRQPQAMPARLQTALAEQLERLAASALPAFTRATLLETLRNTIVMAQGAVRRKFAFAPRPPAGDAQESFTLSTRLWTALAGGYLQCFEAFAAEAADRQVLATAGHRAMLTCRLALEDHFVAGIEPPPALWYRMQRLIQAASVLDVVATKVADPEFRDPSETTIADQYALAALMALSDPYRWNAAAYAVALRAFTRWRTQVTLAASSVDDPKLRWVSLAALAPLPPIGDVKAVAWLEVHQVRRKLRKRIEALDAGETPEALHLGRELSAAGCRELLDSILDHLRAAYSDSQEKPAPVDSDCELAVGPLGCFELLADRPFAATGKPLDLTSSRIRHERVAVFGSADRVEDLRPQRHATGEAWRLKAESVRVAELWRPAGSAGARMLPGQLVVFRDARGSASLAVVTRAWVRQDGVCEISLRRMPGRPDVMTARATDLQNEPPFPCFVLPDVPAVGSTASLLLPTGIASRLRYGLSAQGEETLRCNLGKLLERGADFERYAFAPR